MRIVLLHGLLRGLRSMRRMAAALERDGHQVHSITYPSSSLPYNLLLRNVRDQLHARGLDGGDDVGFIAHSLGGLVWRDLRRVSPGFICGRSVLLGSPIRGSIVARTIGQGTLGRLFFGPAVEELAAERNDEPGYPGPFATVAGTRWTPLLPAAHILRRVAPGRRSDSTVLVDETRSAEALHHAEVDEVHTHLPSSFEVISLVKRFVGSGRRPDSPSWRTAEGPLTQKED